MIEKVKRYIEINLAEKFDDGRIMDPILASIAADAEYKKRNILTQQNFNEAVIGRQNESLSQGQWPDDSPQKIERQRINMINNKIIEYLGDVAATQAVKEQLHYESDLLNSKLYKQDIYKTYSRKQAINKIIYWHQKLDKHIECIIGQASYPEEISEDYSIAII